MTLHEGNPQRVSGIIYVVSIDLRVKIDSSIDDRACLELRNRQLPVTSVQYIVALPFHVNRYPRAPRLDPHLGSGFSSATFP